METLIPFDAIPEDFSLQAEVQRHGDILHIRYLVLGRGAQTLYLPHPAPSESGQSVRFVRRDELWKSTCFELFLSVEGQTEYYELNFSPTGEWNAYRFNAYREGMETEMRIQLTQLRHGLTKDQFELQASIDLSELVAQVGAQLGATNPVFDASLTSVVQNKKGETSFWALRHVGNQPNFHLRDSFVLKIRG